MKHTINMLKAYFGIHIANMKYKYIRQGHIFGWLSKLKFNFANEVGAEVLFYLSSIYKTIYYL